MMENLPRDVALNILSRLPITSLMQIKGVCKLWCSLAQDPCLISMFHARAIENPCLILHCDCPIQNKLYFVGTGDEPDHYRNKARRIDARIKSVMPDYHVFGSCNGLLCLSDALYFDPTCVCNPFTGDCIELPEANRYIGQEVALGFGYLPTTMEYKVVRISFYETTNHIHRYRYWSEKSDVQIFTLGTDAWRSLGSVPWKLDRQPSEASLNAALHWVTRRYKEPPGPRLKIISFDLAEETFKEIERPSCGSLNFCNFHLVVLGGCLGAAVCCEDGKIEIWVMKNYNVKESWTKDYVIGTHSPTSLTQNARPDSRIWKRGTLSKGAIQVVCILKNGTILLEYENRGLVLYNPESEEFKELVISGLPKWFCSITHVESLLPVEVILGR